jgi:hypothetical protein
MLVDIVNAIKDKDDLYNNIIKEYYSVVNENVLSIKENVNNINLYSKI